MTGICGRVLMASLILVLVPAAAYGHGFDSGVGDPIPIIEDDYRNGLLTLDNRALLILKAIRSPGELPEKYRLGVVAGASRSTLCVSMVLKDIRMQWDLLSVSVQRTYLEAMDRARWSTNFVYDTPGGYFKLHYDTDPDSAHAVPPDDTNSSGVPDFVEKCGAYCDTAHSKHLELGYMLPPSDGGLGGDERHDVYFENTGYYGYSWPEMGGPMPWNDYISYMVLNSDFLGFEPNEDPEGDQWGAAKVTAAHEYHHCVQYAYDGEEDTWYSELDAVYMEDIVFDHTNDNYNYLDSYFPEPQTSLMDNSFQHMYSSFIWGLFLAQKFDTSLMRAVWEGARYYTTVFDALSDTLLGRYGWTQDSAFAEFAVWNFCTSIRDDGLHHDEATNYPLVAVADTHSTYPVTLQASPSNPAGYAAAYIEFWPGSREGTLELVFNGSDSREWAAYVIKSTSENIHEFEKMELDPVSYIDTVEVLSFESYYRVTLVGINVSEFSDSAPFTYAADIYNPFACSSVVLTTDSAVYSGGARGFEYQVFNTSPLNDVFWVTAGDENGWAEDSIDIPILSGRDTILAIPVCPPEGTPLGDTSRLHFKIESWSDPGVSHSLSVVAKVMLQRGDVNFSGVIDIADLIYLVDYIFLFGASPLPVQESGNFDCVDAVDISDLVAMVEYMFEGGPRPPCNPF